MKKRVGIFFIIALCTGLYLGSIPVMERGESVRVEALVDSESSVSLSKVLINNLTVGCLIVIGSITYGLIGLVIVFHSGYTISLFYFSFASHYGYKLALALLIPHGIIEIFWLFILFRFSINLGNKLFAYLNNQIELSLIFKSQSKNQLIFGFALIIASGLVEKYISNNIAILLLNS